MNHFFGEMRLGSTIWIFIGFKPYIDRTVVFNNCIFRFCLCLDQETAAVSGSSQFVICVVVVGIVLYISINQMLLIALRLILSRGFDHAWSPLLASSTFLQIRLDVCCRLFLCEFTTATGCFPKHLVSFRLDCIQSAAEVFRLEVCSCVWTGIFLVLLFKEHTFEVQ